MLALHVSPSVPKWPLASGRRSSFCCVFTKEVALHACWNELLHQQTMSNVVPLVLHAARQPLQSKRLTSQYLGRLPGGRALRSLPLRNACNYFHPSVSRPLQSLPPPTSPELSYKAVLSAYSFMEMDPTRSYTLEGFRERKNSVSQPRKCSTGNADIVHDWLAQSAIRHMTGQSAYTFTREKAILQNL